MENVLDYLEKTAKKYPTQIAVEDENTSLMWAELVYRAKRIGSVLCDQMKRQDAVVIVAERAHRPWHICLAFCMQEAFM